MINTRNIFMELGSSAFRTASSHGFHERIPEFGGSTQDTRHILSWLALIGSEIAEAVEEVRKGTLEGLAEELADVIIRTVDMAYALGIDLDHAVEAKMFKNENREFKHGGKRA